MDRDRRILQIGVAALLCVLLLHSGLPGVLAKALVAPQTISTLLFLETGHILRPGQAQPEPTEPKETGTVPTQPAETQEQEDTPAALPVFSESDSTLVEVNSVCGYETDLSGWLQKPLSWDLMQSQPSVLILHTHTTESYTKTEDYQETSQYRTLDKDYNVVSMGEELKRVLEAGGVGVIHDKTIHDYPSFSGAYGHARKTIKEYLDQYPSIRMVLDLHRDSVEDSKGQQVRYVTDVNGEKAARLMLVVGTDANGLKHTDWPDNMALAVKLHAQMEKNNPGICRPISFRKQRFNQDLSAGALIVEVGSAGNTRQEALLAVRELGQTILQLAKGTAQ